MAKAAILLQNGPGTIVKRFTGVMEVGAVMLLAPGGALQRMQLLMIRLLQKDCLMMAQMVGLH